MAIDPSVSTAARRQSPPLVSSTDTNGVVARLVTPLVARADQTVSIRVETGQTTTAGVVQEVVARESRTAGCRHCMANSPPTRHSSARGRHDHDRNAAGTGASGRNSTIVLEDIDRDVDRMKSIWDTGGRPFPDGSAYQFARAAWLTGDDRVTHDEQFVLPLTLVVHSETHLLCCRRSLKPELFD